MRITSAIQAFVGLVGLAAFCQGQTAAASGVDLKAIDKTADPCQNFYLYACGSWMKANPIPPQYSRWVRFSELLDKNQQVLHEILDDSATHQDRSAVDQKIGAFYASCMNETEIERAGAQPIQAALTRIAALKDKTELATEVGRLHNQGISVFFRFGSMPDPDHSTMTIADVDQGGLGLPDKSYYSGAKDEEMRSKYIAHVATMFRLVGQNTTESDSSAKAVMATETALASASLERVARRNPHLLHHPMPVSQLTELTPSFNFKRYFTERGSPAFDSLNVSVPDFFKGVESVLASTSLDDLKSYLTWHLVSAYAPGLSKAFVDANFDFYQRTLTGAKELQPRWKRCVQSTDANLGEALGRKYVEKAFAGQAKEKTQELVGIIEKQMAADIDSLPWMSGATKQQALAKLKGVTNKIGYPDTWKDYASVTVTAGDFTANVRGAREYEMLRNLRKIGVAVDRAEFNMTPPTVNAYYNPLENNINFPAGILQPPFYNKDADLAINLGGIGAVIGHELTHGFDDQGRQFDADGNLRDWWTKQDADEFKKRVDCIVDEYSRFSPVEGVNLNGRLTLGENGADNAGIRLAYMALLGGLEQGAVNKGTLDGFTPQQRFFLGYAQVWCGNNRPESLRNTVRTDPHSPGEFRVTGVLQNMPEFAAAFSCSANQPMVSANACRVW